MMRNAFVTSLIYLLAIAKDVSASEVATLNSGDRKLLDICALYDAMIEDQDQSVQDAGEKCKCNAEDGISCVYDEICTTDEQEVDEQICIKDADFNVTAPSDDFSADMSMCALYADGGYEMFCLKMAIADMNLETCTEATYGTDKKPCDCSVCTIGKDKGVQFDCSAYNPDATSGGCQKINFAEPEQTVKALFKLTPGNEGSDDKKGKSSASNNRVLMSMLGSSVMAMLWTLFL